MSGEAASGSAHAKAKTERESEMESDRDSESLKVPCLRNWLELPTDVTASILSRLGALEILERAQKVCTQWYKICKEPSMWKSIDMRNPGDLHVMPYCLEKMCMHAIDRSCGGLVDINIEYFGIDDHLTYITESDDYLEFILAIVKAFRTSRGTDIYTLCLNIHSLCDNIRQSGKEIKDPKTSNLRCLRLIECWDVSDEGLSEAAPKFPLLEELEIYSGNTGKEAIEAFGRCCPLLKTFQFNRVGIRDPSFQDDEEALTIAENLPGLRQLHLIGNTLTNHGLQAILDGCSNLELLDLRRCFHVNLEGDMGKKCAEKIRNLRLPNDSVDDFKFRAEEDSGFEDSDYESSEDMGGGFFYDFLYGSDSDLEFYGYDRYDSEFNVVPIWPA